MKERPVTRPGTMIMGDFNDTVIDWDNSYAKNKEGSMTLECKIDL